MFICLINNLNKYKNKLILLLLSNVLTEIEIFIIILTNYYIIMTI